MNFPDWLKLLGIAAVVVGLALKLRTTLVVVAAALVTWLLAGLPLVSDEGPFRTLKCLTAPGRAGGRH